MSELSTPAERGRKKVSPTIAAHALTLYQEFVKRATEEFIGDNDTHTVFRGSIVDVYRATKISNTHYTRLFRLLEECGSFEIIERGGLNTESTVILHGEPELENLVQLGHSPLTDAPKAATLKAVQKKLLTLEAMLGGMNIVEAIKNLDNRITKLESQEEKINGT